MHAGDPEEGAVTAQTLGVPEVSRAMPKPDSVILIPASLPAVIAVAGVKENVAVVATAFCGLARVMASPLMAAVICGKVPEVVVSRIAVPSLVVNAAMLAKAACAAVGLVNLVTVKVMTVNALKVPPVSLMVNT